VSELLCVPPFVLPPDVEELSEESNGGFRADVNRLHEGEGVGEHELRWSQKRERTKEGSQRVGFVFNASSFSSSSFAAAGRPLRPTERPRRSNSRPNQRVGGRIARRKDGKEERKKEKLTSTSTPDQTRNSLLIQIVALLIISLADRIQARQSQRPGAKSALRFFVRTSHVGSVKLPTTRRKRVAKKERESGRTGWRRKPEA